MSAGLSQTVVHLFSDIEGSTQLWETYSRAMRSVIQRHDQLVDDLIAEHGGRVVDHAGDGVFAVFEDGSPLACALAIQRAIQSEPWEEIGELRVRMGLHAGKVDPDRSDDRGPLANRTARIMDAAHGGQIVVTPDVLDHDGMPEGAETADLGSHRLKDLADPQPIYQLTHPQLALHEFPELRSLSAHPHNLPTQTTAFVGRADELATISYHLANTEHRLLTLLGPGGAGKTRLSIQAAAEQFETFPDGVFFVALASVPSVESAVYAVADAIGFTFYSNEDPKTQLINYLEGKRLLLIIDNCEHLDGVSRLMSELLGAIPELKVLATSRARLNLKGEVVFDLEGLEVPETPSVDDVDAYSGLRLFVDSAQRARADFTVDEDNLSHIARICRLLNGMPLGIELAAAWIRMLPVDEIIEEIQTSLDFLESAYEDLPERQRSLRAVFDYSWQLLSEQEQAAFAKLSVFRGAFDRKAAKQVAGVSMMALASLVDKSLLHADDEGRYSIHNLLRQYAEEQLAQDPEQHHEALQSHGSYVAERLEAWKAELTGERQLEGLNAIQAMFDDVRFMWRTACEQGQWAQIERSVDPLHLYCYRRSRFQEGEALFADATEQVRTAADANAAVVPPTLPYRLEARLAGFRKQLGQTGPAERMIRDALDRARDQMDSPETAYALNVLGTLLRSNDPDSARAFLEESLAIYRDLDDPRGIAISLNDLGVLEFYQGNWEASQNLRDESLSILQRLGDKQEIARIMVNIGSMERHRKNFARAHELYEQSLTMVRDLDDKDSEGKILMNMGILEALNGNNEAGKQLIEQSLAIERELGDKQDIVANIANLSVVESKLGHLDQSRELLEQGLQMAHELGDQRRMALYRHNLGNVLIKQGNTDEARRHFEESLAICRDKGQKRMTTENLSGLAAVLSDEGQTETAARLQGAVSALLAEIGTFLDADERDLYDKTAAALQEALGDAGYEEAFAAGQDLSPEAAIGLTKAQGTDSDGT